MRRGFDEQAILAFVGWLLRHSGLPAPPTQAVGPGRNGPLHAYAGLLEGKQLITPKLMRPNLVACVDSLRWSRMEDNDADTTATPLQSKAVPPCGTRPCCCRGCGHGQSLLPMVAPRRPEMAIGQIVGEATPETCLRIFNLLSRGAISRAFFQSAFQPCGHNATAVSALFGSS